VSFPIQAFNAIDREQSDIHFHQLHADCHRRIHYQKVCPQHGEISNDEIVSGYEYTKGKYIEVEPEELDALRTKAERALTIDAFIEPEMVDPLYFDGGMYYLLPQNATAEEPYAVMAEAMKREGRVGIGQIVFSGKDQLVLIRPIDGVLHMAMLNYDEEIRPPKEFMSGAIRPTGLHRQVKLAQSLIRSWSSDRFDFASYDDRYRQRVQKLVNAKLKGHKVEAPEEEEEEPDVINLMEALKRTVSKEKPRGTHRKSPKRRRRA